MEIRYDNGKLNLDMWGNNIFEGRLPESVLAYVWQMTPALITSLQDSLVLHFPTAGSVSLLSEDTTNLIAFGLSFELAECIRVLHRDGYLEFRPHVRALLLSHTVGRKEFIAYGRTDRPYKRPRYVSPTFLWLGPATKLEAEE